MRIEVVGAFIIFPCVLLIAVLILVCRYRWFIKQMEKEGENRPRISMMNDKPSYEKYKRIASRKSVRSNPVRKDGDFLDFILSYDGKKDANAIESKLSGVEVGEGLEFV